MKNRSENSSITVLSICNLLSFQGKVQRTQTADPSLTNKKRLSPDHTKPVRDIPVQYFLSKS